MMSTMATTGEVTVLGRLWAETVGEDPPIALLSQWRRCSDAQVDAWVDGLMAAGTAGLDEYLDMFETDSAALTWANMRAAWPDSPKHVKAFANGGLATPDVWQWLAAARLRVLNGEQPPKHPCARTRRQARKARRERPIRGGMLPPLPKPKVAAKATRTETVSGIPIVWAYERRPNKDETWRKEYSASLRKGR